MTQYKDLDILTEHELEVGIVSPIQQIEGSPRDIKDIMNGTRRYRMVASTLGLCLRTICHGDR